MSVTPSELTQLYLAYFGRPPDFDGLQFYMAEEEHFKVVAHVTPGMKLPLMLHVLEVLAVKDSERNLFSGGVVINVKPQIDGDDTIYFMGAKEALDQLTGEVKLGFFADPSPPVYVFGTGASIVGQALTRWAETIDMKMTYVDSFKEGGLASQAPGYASPRLSAKMLRREAMRPRGSKGR
jgi:hypothetical protein